MRFKHLGKYKWVFTTKTVIIMTFGIKKWGKTHYSILVDRDKILLKCSKLLAFSGKRVKVPITIDFDKSQMQVVIIVVPPKNILK